jgi:cbb3-type cytochrome oxidase subunit 3
MEMLNQVFAFLNANFLYLFLLQVLFLVFAFTLIMRANYSPTEKAVWIILILCFPLLGLILFFIFRNQTKKKEEPAANEPLDLPRSRP